MGFNFAYICDLLSALERNRHLHATSAAKAQNPDFRTIANWCLNHSKRIHDKDTDLLALLSCLFPEKRPDRVYWLQHTSLARIIGRCLYMGTSRLKDLNRWQAAGGGDLGQCVETVMSQAENQIPVGNEVTVEEIDDALNQIASRCRFSGPNVRKMGADVDVDQILGSIYRRLSSLQAKWFTRMILKSFHPVQVPSDYLLKKIHFLLPHLMLFQDSLEAAVSLVKSSSLKLFPHQPQSDIGNLLEDKALEHFIPRIGIKIGRPEYLKARSIKHCCDLIRQRRMSVERKYDGEYCQVHVDLTRGEDCIQIFSKSGKDSTLDRAGIHNVIKSSLAIGQTNCKVSRRCILEGELLVWDDHARNIMEFHKLRKFLSRSGVFIGTELDSQPKPHEHLMIVFFDILLLDDIACLSKPHRIRRLMLKDTIKCTPGRAEISEQQIIDFSRPDAVRQLQLALSRSIAERWEGFVIKACDEPYFSARSSGENDRYARWIKLKKDYIPGLGDTADFALIGARYEPKHGSLLSENRQLSWTEFFIGCLDNKEDVRRLASLPRFRIVDTISIHSLNKNDIQVLNQWGKFVACSLGSNSAFECYSTQNALPEMDVTFKTPFVVELLGGGFDKPTNAQYYSLRFPRVLKIHWDRSFEDTISFTELQELARRTISIPTEELEEENNFWLEKVVGTNRRSEYLIDHSQSNSATSFSTFSPGTKSEGHKSPILTLPSVDDTAVSTTRKISHTLHTSIDERLVTSSTTKGKHTFSSAHHLSNLNLTLRKSVSSWSNLHSASCLQHRNPSSTVMNTSLLLNQDEHQSLRARGSPVPRSWTSSIDSHCTASALKSGQSSKLDSGFTTPLREKPNPSVAAPPNRVASTFAEAWQFISDATSASPESNHSMFDNDPVGIPTKLDLNLILQPFNNIPQDTLDRAHCQPYHTISPLSTLPIYCGAFGFQEETLRYAARDFTFSAKHFVKSLASQQFRERLRYSNPRAAENDLALGIVLVNIKDSPRILAIQLHNIGNLLVSELSQPNNCLPSRGKIFFLDSRILRAGGQDGIENDMFLLNDWWADYGTQYFYASISWTKANNNTTQMPTGHHPMNHQFSSAASIVNLYEPSDVEILGEFVSIHPTVHLDGDFYHSPQAKISLDDPTAHSAAQAQVPPITTRFRHLCNHPFSLCHT